MRTTVTLAPDVAAAVADIQRRDGVGISAALNDLVRRGLASPEDRPAFVQRTHPMGMRVDVRNVAEVLDSLDAASER